jgi:uncharacterized OB-fold protein
MDLPKPESNELSRPYWDALEQGHLVYQCCDCGHAWLPARRLCPSCLQPSVRWERSVGKGRLISWVVYHIAYHEAFADRLPYNVALVELDEGPRLITNILDSSETLRGDARVALQVDNADGFALARFRLLT